MIANDVTVQSGSFGVQEDDFFFKASVYARERGTKQYYLIPHSYLASTHCIALHPSFLNKLCIL